MNPNEPKSFKQLYHWLDRMRRVASDFPFEPLAVPFESSRNVQSVYMWLCEFERTHTQAIEEAADRIWLHEKDTFRDLQDPVGSLLILRIERGRDLIEELITKNEAPFVYPDVTFRELVHWILIDWWSVNGFRRASLDIFVRENQA